MKLFEISLVNDSQLYYTSVTLRCYLKEKKIQLRISESKTKNNESKTNYNENSYTLVFTLKFRGI